MENIATGSTQLTFSQVSQQDFASLRDFVYSQAYSNYSNLVGKLDLSINMLVGIFTVLAIIMGFLVWRNYRLSEESKSDLIRTRNYLNEIKREATNLLKAIKSIADESKSILEKRKKEVDEIKIEMEKILKESKNLQPIYGKLTDLSGQIDNDIISLGTISSGASISPSSSVSSLRGLSTSDNDIPVGTVNLSDFLRGNKNNR